MKAENRRKSMKKWAEVRRLVEKERYMEANTLATSMYDCGHCSEYFSEKKDSCGKCPLQTEENGKLKCHTLILEVTERLSFLNFKNIDTEEVGRILKIIKAVQKLVMTK